MIYTLNNELQQTYKNANGTVKVDLLYNDSFDYFYFNIFLNGELIKGDTRVVNEFKNNYVNFLSNKADYATFEAVKSFTLEVFDEQ